MGVPKIGWDLGVGMLNNAIVHAHPFPHVTGTTQIPHHQLDAWMSLFSDEAAWQQRTESFYTCALREVTSDIDEVWTTQLRKSVTRLLQIPLLPHCSVTAQKMTSGQRIGIHSDQPRLGYEIARVVLQLNKGWAAGDGGVLEVYADTQNPPLLSHPPYWNSATAFILHPESFHSVSRTLKTRCSLVFNFWHPGNAPTLEHTVDEWLEGLHFGDLPASLDKEASDAEQYLEEGRTYRAGVVAWLLQRWGFGEDIVLAGYRVSVGQSIGPGLSYESRIAITWASWVAELHRGAFCPRRWTVVKEETKEWQNFPRLLSQGQALFPVEDG